MYTSRTVRTSARFRHVYLTPEPVSDLYIVLYDAIATQGPDNVDHGSRAYYFGENGEHRLYDVAKKIAEGLVKCGKAQSAEPIPFTDEELKKYPMVCLISLP